MEPLAAFRTFADHYTFTVADSEADPCPSAFLDTSEGPQPGVLGNFEVGYITDGRSILVGTCPHLNVDWIELFRSKRAPNFGTAQRVIALPLEVSSGRVDFSTLEVDAKVFMTAGIYTVYSLGFSLGGDRMTDPAKPPNWAEQELTDEELAAHTDYEHYQIVFVPGRTTDGRVGVIHGAPDIATVREQAQPGAPASRHLR